MKAQGPVYLLAEAAAEKIKAGTDNPPSTLPQVTFQVPYL